MRSGRPSRTVAAIDAAGPGKGYAIRVNAILPGVVETDMIRGVIDRAPDPAAARAAFEEWRR